jgi:DNA processing protein
MGMIPNVGHVTAKKLIAYTGSAEAVFFEKKKNLEKIPGVGAYLAKAIAQQNILGLAEAELNTINKHNIEVLFYLDKAYPQRLNHCEDAPILLYKSGNCELNHQKVLSFVGTRDATPYGREMCEKLISGLKERGHHVLVVSGLAYGIDVCAHKAALKEGFETVGVLGHGLGFLYPSLHRQVASKMMEQGSLLSEFVYSQKPEPSFFVKRNRIVAGMADATIVVESGVKGGALITADIANSYNRDVFAVPGNAGNPSSAGCNKLIKANKASLIESVEDIEYLLGWDVTSKKRPVQRELFVELSEEENIVYDILKAHKELVFDQIFLLSKMPVSKVSTLLLNLEFSGLVKSLPGKVYKMV